MIDNMGTYRTVYNQKIYNDLSNFLKGKKKDMDSFKCVSELKFDFLDGKIGYGTPYDMMIIELGEKPIVQLTTYNQDSETGSDNPFYEEIDTIRFDNCIVIITKLGTEIEIFSTKEIERQFKGIITFKD